MSEQTGLASAAEAPPRQRRARIYTKSGVFRLKRSLKERGLKALDGRTALARSVSAWRSEVESDLGGVSELSRSEKTLLDMCASSVAMLTVIDAFIASRPELIVIARKRTLAPVVRERIAVANHVKDLLTTLGLKRRVRDVPSLRTYLAAKAGTVEASQASERA